MDYAIFILSHLVLSRSENVNDSDWLVCCRLRGEIPQVNGHSLLDNALQFALLLQQYGPAAGRQLSHLNQRPIPTSTDFHPTILVVSCVCACVCAETLPNFYTIIQKSKKIKNCYFVIRLVNQWDNFYPINLAGTLVDNVTWAFLDLSGFRYFIYLFLKTNQFILFLRKKQQKTSEKLFLVCLFCFNVVKLWCE